MHYFGKSDKDTLLNLTNHTYFNLSGNLGNPSRKYMGICLETQGLPDAIHHQHFPSWVLKEGEPYASVTKYKFSVD